MQKRYANGLSFLGSYTWAHAFDNTTDLLGGDYGAYKQSALIPIKYEWGQSGYDIRHRAVINVDYDLPFGEGRQWVNHGGILNADHRRMEDRHGVVGPDRPAVYGQHQQNRGLAERQRRPGQQRRQDRRPDVNRSAGAESGLQAAIADVPRERHHRRGAVEYSRECLRGADPHEDALVQPVRLCRPAGCHQHKQRGCCG